MTTERECLDALREAAAELGASPTKAQYEDLGLTPASATIIRVCRGWNAAKEKAGLATNPSRGSRVGSKPDGLDVSDEEWAAMSVDQRWYYRNREEDIAMKRARRTALRTWLNEQKERLVCERCGESSSRCLDFHHRDRDEKRLAVGKMVAYGYGKPAIRGEISKCEVLCANCHSKAHAPQFLELPESVLQRIRADVRARRAVPDSASLTKERYLRAWAAAYKRSAGCSRCQITDERCLQFHHTAPGSKTASVSALITHCHPADEVVEEVKRCAVLCANCHRIEHRTSDNPETERGSSTPQY